MYQGVEKKGLISWIVDTGADSTYLSEEAITNLGLDADDEGDIWAFVQIEGQANQICASITPSNSDECILGRDVFNRYCHEINPTSGTHAWARCDNKKTHAWMNVHRERVEVEIEEIELDSEDEDGLSFQGDGATAHPPEEEERDSERCVALPKQFHLTDLLPNSTLRDIGPPMENAVASIGPFQQ